MWGQPQQPGMPPSGPMHQQPPPGVHPGGPPPNQFGQFGGPGQEPPKKKTGLIVGLAIAAVAVIGGVVALIVLLSGDDDTAQDGQSRQASPTGAPADSSGQLPPSGQPGQPDSSTPGMPPADPGSGGVGDDAAAVQELTDELMAAANNRDNAAFNALLCPGSGGEATLQNLPDDVVFEQNGEIEINGDNAVIPIKASDGQRSDEGKFEASKQGNQWCVSGSAP